MPPFAMPRWLLATFAGPVLLALAFAAEPITTWGKLAGAGDVGESTGERPVERFRSYFPRDEHAPDVHAGKAEDERGVRPPAPAAETAAAAPSPAGGQADRNNDPPAATSPAVWLGAVWASGVFVLLMRLGLHLRRASALLRGAAHPVSPVLQDAYDFAIDRLGLRRRVRLAVHPDLTSPVFVGGMRPAVLWPTAEQDGMSPAERHAAMVHEQGHAARRDDWVNLAAELWRAASWFYPPVHWLLARLRREQEYLSDDLAARLFDRPETYARLLLHLAPVRVDAGGVCTAFVGAGLQGRIRRLLTARLRHLVPLGRARVIGLALAGIALFAGAGSLRLVGLAEEPASADAATPLPETTPQELAEKVREALTAYDSGVVEATFLESRMRDDLQPPELASWEGRFQYASDGYRWRGEYESQTYSRGERQLRPRGWSAGFDGEVHYQRPLRGSMTLGEQQAHEGIPLPEFVWSSHGAGFAESLAEDDWQIERQETVGGHRCYVLVREAEFDRFFQRQELTLSPRQGYLPVRYKVFSNEKLNWTHELFRLAQTESGVWYPRRIRKMQTWLSNRIIEVTVTRYESHPLFDAAYFRPKFPWGEHVRDWRTGEVYLNDPWWPEVEPLVREQGDRPPDFMPLRDMASQADPTINGEPAPPLAVAEWIRGEPVDLDTRRGNVTLLFFSGGSLWSPEPAQVSALREVYEVYRPFGLEIIGIVTHSTDADAARQQVEELRIPWPVAMDSEGGSYGRTFEAYRLKSYLSPVLVDHEGEVHLVQQGQLPAQLKRLLEAAGARDVPEISLEYRRDVPRYGDQLWETWEEMVRESPKPARIVGTVTDKGGPLPGVHVEANLRLELTGSIHTTAATAVFPYRNEVFRTTTDKDGKYVLADLCKGAYMLSFKSPVRAIVERRVVLAPDEMAESIDVDLSQRDGIQGRVLDESGQPISEAQVTIRHRHPYLADLSFTSTFYTDPSVTDPEGRFEFKDLQTGAYTLDVSHPDYENGSLEHIPAGETEAVVRLSRGGG